VPLFLLLVSLSLFVFWIFTDHHYTTFASDHSALVADWFDRWSNFHLFSSCVPPRICTLLKCVAFELAIRILTET